MPVLALSEPRSGAVAGLQPISESHPAAVDSIVGSSIPPAMLQALSQMCTSQPPCIAVSVLRHAPDKLYLAHVSRAATILKWQKRQLTGI